MSLSKDLQEFTSAFSSSYKMFSDAEEKRAAHAETARHNKETEALNTERVRGASKEELEGAEGIRKKYQTSTDTPGAGGGSSKGASSGITATDLPPEAGGFLDAISGPESAGKYDVRYTPQGGTKFDLSTGTHPGIYEPTKSGQKSSAAGRYQFVKSTWDDITKDEKDKSFTPENQDRMAWKLAQRDYKQRTGGDLLSELRTNGITPKLASIMHSTWEGVTGANAPALNANYATAVQRYAQAPNTRDVAGTQPKIAGVERTAIPPPEGATAAPAPAAAPAKTAAYKPKPYEPGDERGRLQAILDNPASPQPQREYAQEQLAKLNQPKPQAAIAPGQQFAEAEPEEEEPTAFSAAGGAIPDPSGNYGAPRAFTQKPDAQTAPASSVGGSQVGGAGFVPRRVGQAPAYRAGAAGGAALPAGVGYGVGQNTPGQQAMIDRRQAKADAAAAAAAAAAAPKPQTMPVGNQWDPKYGNAPNPDAVSLPWNPNAGMTKDQLDAMPDSAFSGNPQAFAAMHPGTQNYVRWRVGEDAWARGQQQQDQWSRGQNTGGGGGRAAGGPVERVKSYAEGGSVEDDDEFNAPVIPEPSQDRDIGREALAAPTPKEKTQAKTDVRKAEHDDDAEAARRRMAERAKHREALDKAQPEQTPVQAQVGKPTGPPDDPERAPKAGPESKPTPGTGRRGAVPQEPSEAYKGRDIVGAEGTVVPTEPQPETAIPQAPGASGGRMGAPRGGNVPPPGPAPQAVPAVDEMGNPILPQETGPGQPPPRPLADRMSGVVGAEGAVTPTASQVAPAASMVGQPLPQGITQPQQGPSPPPTLTAPAPSMTAALPPPVGEPTAIPPSPSAQPAPAVDDQGRPMPAGGPAPPAAKPPPSPEPQPGKPSPSQQAVNPEGSDNPAGPAVTRGMKKANEDEKKKQGAVPDPNAAPDYGKGGHVMTQADRDAVANTVDPQRRMTDGDRNIAMYRELEDYWLSKGRPDKAAEASLGLTMYNRRAAQSTGGMALAALDKGDIANAARWLSKGFNYIPNNQSLHVSPDADGQGIEYRVLDNRTGKEIEVGHADRGQLAAMAQGVMSGKEFDQQIWNILGKGKGAAGPKGPSEGDKKAADKQEFEDTRKAAVEAGKGIASDPNKQKEFDEKVSRLRSIGGHDPATIKAITSVYQEAGIPLPDWLKTETKGRGGKEPEAPLDDKAITSARVAADKARDALKENPDDPDLKRDYSVKASALAALFPPKIRDVRMKSAGHDPKGYQTMAAAPELPPAVKKRAEDDGATAPPVWDGEKYRYTTKDGSVKFLRPPPQ